MTRPDNKKQSRIQKPLTLDSQEQNILVVDMGSEYIDEICDSINHSGIEYTKIKYDYQYINRMFEDDLPSYDKLIISGSKRNVFEDDRPDIPLESLSLTPILGICYGSQLIADRFGIEMERCNGDEGECGDSILEVLGESKLFKGIDFEEDNIIHQWHWWRLKELPDGFKLTSSTKYSPIGSFEKGNIYCLQWHPEMTELGRRVIKNFLSL